MCHQILSRTLLTKMVNNYFNNNNFFEGSANNGVANNTNNEGFTLTFNPLEKLMEIIAENKALYEQLLKVEREKNTLLEKLLSDKFNSK